MKKIITIVGKCRSLVQSVLTLLTFSFCTAQAKPVDIDPSAWECCPLSWKFDGAAKTVRARKGPNDLAVLNAAERSAQVTVSARLSPESSGTNGGATMGVAIVDDSRNFWHLALVQAPPERRGSGDGGRHAAERGRGPEVDPFRSAVCVHDRGREQPPDLCWNV